MKNVIVIQIFYNSYLKSNWKPLQKFWKKKSNLDKLNVLKITKSEIKVKGSNSYQLLVDGNLKKESKAWINKWKDKEWIKDIKNFFFKAKA